MRLFTLPALIFIFLSSPAILWADENGTESNTATSSAHQSYMPERGSTMNQVKKKFGDPKQIIAPKGKTSKNKPPITRWVYDNYIVYFENNRVIHSAQPRSLNFIELPDTPDTTQQSATEQR